MGVVVPPGGDPPPARRSRCRREGDARVCLRAPSRGRHLHDDARHGWHLESGTSGAVAPMSFRPPSSKSASPAAATREQRDYAAAMDLIESASGNSAPLAGVIAPPAAPRRKPRSALALAGLGRRAVKRASRGNGYDDSKLTVAVDYANRAIARTRRRGRPHRPRVGAARAEAGPRRADDSRRRPPPRADLAASAPPVRRPRHRRRRMGRGGERPRRDALGPHQPPPRRKRSRTSPRSTSTQAIWTPPTTRAAARSTSIPTLGLGQGQLRSVPGPARRLERRPRLGAEGARADAVRSRQENARRGLLRQGRRSPLGPWRRARRHCRLPERRASRSDRRVRPVRPRRLQPVCRGKGQERLATAQAWTCAEGRRPRPEGRARAEGAGGRQLRKPNYRGTGCPASHGEATTLPRARRRVREGARRPATPPRPDRTRRGRTSAPGGRCDAPAARVALRRHRVAQMLLGW